MKTLLVVVGPTAVGKTALAIQLAQHFQTAIISADSRQFYREMAIGTAKPSLEEQAAAPHYFIDSHSLETPYSAGDFEVDALAKLEELFKTQDEVVMVGGSGLFVKAVCEGLDNLPKATPGVRDRLNAEFEAQGIAPLQARLAALDPAYYKEVDQHNPQRIIRALEVCESTGLPFSSFRKNALQKRPFRIVTIGLTMDRAKLYERINLRVDKMLQEGLIEEVTSLMEFRSLPALQTVGYAEIFDYLEGSLSLSEAVEKVKQNSRRYAKRQLTWFHKDQQTQWFEPTDWSNIMAYITEQKADSLR
ncbi:tRNA (adenosine(37)-N6)-dimethylallyltransferase MiaA [Sphingobacteriaceae bacterium WQ 2009]|uniref:tRNA dimethylallyltransferase n=1 Tax=Rhinopithecimicrobium faecis TaxID=2820698 RepID=A0A8T4H589_9SPHI|nr:tRNA (adenosine(37)-N6)-dimethylallyltransferase MiaA [Sphingobacteriaceae bacterium WQ 2009]